MLVVRLLHDQQLQIVRPHVEQSGGCRPQGLPDVDALGFVLDGMELQQIHVGLDRQGQAGDIPAAPLLVNLHKLGNFGRHGVWGLGGSADRANPMAEFPLLHPAGFAEVDQFDALASDVADLRSRRS